MPRSYLLRLNDMLEAMGKIQAVVNRNGNFERYENDRDSQMIVERGFEIVSEASKHLPDELKQRHPDVQWKKIRDIGNKLRHEYQRVSQFVLWETARTHVPDLVEVCRAEFGRDLNPVPKSSPLEAMLDRRKDVEAAAPPPTPKRQGGRSIADDDEHGG